MSINVFYSFTMLFTVDRRYTVLQYLYIYIYDIHIFLVLYIFIYIYIYIHIYVYTNIMIIVWSLQKCYLDPLIGFPGVSDADWLSFNPQEVVYQLQSASQRCGYSRVISQSAVDSLLQQVEMKHGAQGQPVPPRAVSRNGSCGALHCFSV